MESFMWRGKEPSMILNVPLFQWLGIGLFLSIATIHDIITAKSTQHDADSGFIGNSENFYQKTVKKAKTFFSLNISMSNVNFRL